MTGRVLVFDDDPPFQPPDPRFRQWAMETGRYGNPTLDPFGTWWGHDGESTARARVEPLAPRPCAGPARAHHKEPCPYGADLRGAHATVSRCDTCKRTLRLELFRDYGRRRRAAQPKGDA